MLTNSIRRNTFFLTVERKRNYITNPSSVIVTCSHMSPHLHTLFSKPQLSVPSQTRKTAHNRLFSPICIINLFGKRMRSPNIPVLTRLYARLELLKKSNRSRPSHPKPPTANSTPTATWGQLQSSSLAHSRRAVSSSSSSIGKIVAFLRQF